MQNPQELPTKATTGAVSPASTSPRDIDVGTSDDNTSATETPGRDSDDQRSSRRLDEKRPSMLVVASPSKEKSSDQTVKKLPNQTVTPLTPVTPVTPSRLYFKSRHSSLPTSANSASPHLEFTNLAHIREDLSPGHPPRSPLSDRSTPSRPRSLPPQRRPQKANTLGNVFMNTTSGVPHVTGHSGNKRHTRILTTTFGRLNRIVGLERYSMKPTFYCHICLENKIISERFILTCTHDFCKGCISKYIEFKIANGDVSEAALVCPHKQSSDEDLHCDEPIAFDLIHLLVDDNTNAKFERFRRIQSNPNARICPSCETLVEPKDEANPPPADMQCSNCELAFCFYHSDAHIGSTCAEYESSIKESESRSRAWTEENAKNCPGCKRAIEKISGGCNHMTCRCGVEFCWLCGRRFDPNARMRHYDPYNFLGCPGAQFGDSEQVSLKQRRITSAVAAVCLGPLFLIVCVLIAVLCCPCYVAFTCTEDEDPEDADGDELEAV
eukprot:GFYU01000809.1.p1 GENE.GFYU01000809.1~~GFYU01000809.1.p1  ORF type:complete len:496 (-),score=73.44 GFYU01000809.1:145-1632(-)